MKAGRQFSVRTWCTVLVCSALIATVGFAGTAGATTPIPSHAAPFVQGHDEDLGQDPTCPRAEGFEEYVNDRQVITGIVKTRIGPARLKLDLCRIFSGALGGISVQGTFTLTTFAGTLRGAANGANGFGAHDYYNITLTVERGSFLLKHVTGTLDFHADVLPGFPGTLTSNLSITRGWGRWSRTVPVPLT
jgi:hypothetical protein